jgi:hypothetical protein
MQNKCRETAMGDGGLFELADYLQGRRGDILLSWRSAIRKDPALTSSDSLPRADLYDHIPALLTIFEQRLRQGRRDSSQSHGDAGQAAAAAHGLQRWQQGYDLREVTRRQMRGFGLHSAARASKRASGNIFNFSSRKQSAT